MSSQPSSSQARRGSANKRSGRRTSGAGKGKPVEGPEFSGGEADVEGGFSESHGEADSDAGQELENITARFLLSRQDRIREESPDSIGSVEREKYGRRPKPHASSQNSVSDVEPALPAKTDEDKPAPEEHPVPEEFEYMRDIFPLSGAELREMKETPRLQECYLQWKMLKAEEVALYQAEPTKGLKLCRKMILDFAILGIKFMSVALEFANAIDFSNEASRDIFYRQMSILTKCLNVLPDEILAVEKKFKIEGQSDLVKVLEAPDQEVDMIWSISEALKRPDEQISDNDSETGIRTTMSSRLMNCYLSAKETKAGFQAKLEYFEATLASDV